MPRVVDYFGYAFGRYGAFSVSAIYLQHFPSYSNHNCKNRHFYVPRPSFLFALGTHLWQSRKTLNEWKDNSVLAKPIAACTHISSTVSQLFEPQCKKSPFSRTAAHIFVSPGDAPGAITLNVVWMEREFDAYKLSRCLCTSNYNRFWDRARYWSKIVIFFIPTLHSTPPLREFPSE